MLLLNLFSLLLLAGIIRTIANVSQPGSIHINTPNTSYSANQMLFAENQTSQPRTYQADISFMRSWIAHICI